MKFLNTLKQPYFNELDSTGGIDETEEVEGLEETEELEQIETPEEPTEEGQPEPRKFKVKFNKEEKEIEEEKERLYKSEIQREVEENSRIDLVAKYRCTEAPEYEGYNANEFEAYRVWKQ